MDSDTTVKLGYERSAIVQFVNEKLPARSKLGLIKLVFGRNFTLLTTSWVQSVTKYESSPQTKR